MFVLVLNSNRNRINSRDLECNSHAWGPFYHNFYKRLKLPMRCSALVFSLASISAGILYKEVLIRPEPGIPYIFHHLQLRQFLSNSLFFGGIWASIPYKPFPYKKNVYARLSTSPNISHDPRKPSQTHPANPTPGIQPKIWIFISWHVFTVSPPPSPTFRLGVCLNLYSGDNLYVVAMGVCHLRIKLGPINPMR